jgi:hypothetical protein
METRKKQWDDELAVIWDVSLSGSQRNLKRELEMLEIIFSEKKNANVHLYFLNNRFKKITNKNTAGGEYKVANGKWSELKKVLETAVFDGGTNFSEININNIKGSEVLFFSDGISTLSDADFLKNIKANRPIHCIVSSSKADYSVMRLVAGKTKGKFVNINALPADKLKSELLDETLQFLGTEHGKDVREVYPSIATPVHGNFSAAGISGAGSAELTLFFGFGNKVEKRVKVQLDAKSAAKQGNVYKIWAQKKIAELDLNFEKNRDELTELGKQFGIVTRNTSLIVLETVDDYIRYGIEPPSELRAEYERRLKESGDRLRNTGLPMSGGAASRAGSSAGVFGSGGFATDVDAVLSGAGGLRSGGDGNVGRKGVAGIGYGSGYGSGFGGSGGNVDDILSGLMGGSGGDGGGGGLDLKKRGELKVSSPDFLKGGALTGGRSRASIQRVIMENMAAMRYEYNRRMRDRPGLSGKIVVKFAIDQAGNVIHAQMEETTINDSTLEAKVVERVRNLKFEEIDKPGDVTEVV